MSHCRKHRGVLEGVARVSTPAISGSYILTRRDGGSVVVLERWVLLEGRRIAAVAPSRPAADHLFGRPGRFVLPDLLNLHNHCFSGR